MRSHPLSRALRMDKASIAGLAATLEHYARGEAVEQVPVWRMIAAPAAALRRRARRWARIAAESAEVTVGRSMIGGGSLPGEGLESPLCAIAPPRGDADAFAAALRAADPPVVARIEHGRVLLDPRTVDPREDRDVEAALRQALDGPAAADAPPPDASAGEASAGDTVGDSAGR